MLPPPPKRVSLVIATPSFDGSFVEAYVAGLLASERALRDADIDMNWVSTSNCPVLSSARASLVATFLESGASHLLFVDADQGFTSVDVLRLLSHDVPFVAAICARWEGGHFDIRGDLQMDPKRPGVARIVSGGVVGLGFAMIQRSVFLRLAEAYPERRMWVQEDMPLYDFFPITVENGEWYHEDQSFEKLWQDIGGDVLVDLSIRVSHWKMTDIAGPVPLAALQAEIDRRNAAAA